MSTKKKEIQFTPTAYQTVIENFGTVTFSIQEEGEVVLHIEGPDFLEYENRYSNIKIPVLMGTDENGEYSDEISSHITTDFIDATIEALGLFRDHIRDMN